MPKREFLGFLHRLRELLARPFAPIAAVVVLAVATRLYQRERVISPGLRLDQARNAVCMKLLSVEGKRWPAARNICASMSASSDRRSRPIPSGLNSC